jgi:hypothetical protein
VLSKVIYISSSSDSHQGKINLKVDFVPTTTGTKEEEERDSRRALDAFQHFNFKPKVLYGLWSFFLQVFFIFLFFFFHCKNRTGSFSRPAPS